MQVAELIKRLLDVLEVNPNAEAVLQGPKGFVEFSGFNVDQNADVALEICNGDIDH